MREPEGNGVAERFIRTLKENLLWLRSFETIEELRVILASARGVRQDMARLESRLDGRIDALESRMNAQHGGRL